MASRDSSDEDHVELAPPGWCIQHIGSGAERLEEYDEGGLCPVHLGDVVGGIDIQSGVGRSFTIVTKLGYGSYSTVWLAKEVSDTSAGAQYIALKCLTERKSTADNAELQILQRIGKLRAAFFCKHPDISRVCVWLGMDPVGATLRECSDNRIGFPVTISCTITFIKTLVSKVLALHELGITHGDISHNNVTLGIHPDSLIPEVLEETKREDKLFEVMFWGSESPPPRPLHYPKYIIYHVVPLYTDEDDMSKVDLIDFGSASLEPSKPGYRGTRYFGAPEVLKGGCATTKSDLWSLGCVIVYGLTRSQLFDLFPPTTSEYVESDEDTKRRIVETKLARSDCLHAHPELAHLIADIVQCLLQPDPFQRDPAKARELVQRLETGDFRCIVEQNNDKDGKRCLRHWDQWDYAGMEDLRQRT